MMTGVLIAESLRVGCGLAVPEVLLTRLRRQDVSGSVSPSQPTVWTLLDFEVSEDRADELADALAAALRPEDGWYADFSSDDEHVVVFSGQVFRYRKGDVVARQRVVAHGLRAGTPEGQLDWGD